MKFTKCQQLVIKEIYDYIKKHNLTQYNSPVIATFPRRDRYRKRTFNWLYHNGHLLKCKSDSINIKISLIPVHFLKLNVL